MPDNDKKKHYVRAAYAPDGPGALAMIELLKDHGIDAFRQGGVKDIYKIGGDIFGEEIMVDPEDLSEAQRLLGSAEAGKPASEAKKASKTKALLCLLAAAALFAVLLFLRGRFL
jgi:hypothetical protein